MSIQIDDKHIGGKNPTYIIAEAGVNHNGDLDRAYAHIKAAKLTGCDAIKFQTYRAEKLVTRTAPKYWHVGDEKVKTQFETFSKLDSFGIQEYKKMQQYANKIGITFFSTPFDLESVDLLEELDVPAYKIASADITFFQMIDKIAKTGKPIILSTGASSIAEIDSAIKRIRSQGNEHIVLLHCMLNYPTKYQDMNLTMIDYLRNTFVDVSVGFSDHTHGSLTPALAVMAGACVIEKHFTIDKGLPDNPDHQLGVDVEEMKILVNNVRIAEKSKGTILKDRSQSEKEAFTYARRSVVSNTVIKKGDKIRPEMIICKRPGTGISAQFLDQVVGRIAKKNIPPDTIMTWDLL